MISGWKEPGNFLEHEAVESMTTVLLLFELKDVRTLNAVQLLAARLGLKDVRGL